MAGQRRRTSNERRHGRVPARRSRSRRRATPVFVDISRAEPAVIRAARKLLGHLRARRLKHRRGSSQRMMRRRWRLWNRTPVPETPAPAAASVVAELLPEIAAAAPEGSRRRCKFSAARAKRRRP